MPSNVSHFPAINAEDLKQARRFYENVFGWTFRPLGTAGLLSDRDGGRG